MSIPNGSDPYYQDELVTLYHGDCLDLADQWTGADVLVSDPPYGVAYTSGRVDGRQRNTTGIKNDRTPQVRDAALRLWGDKPAIVFGSWRVQKPESTRQMLIWDKGNDPGTGDLTMPWGSSFEEIYVIGRGDIWQGGRTVSVLRHNKPGGGDRPDHPTPKPIPLMEQLIVKCPEGVIADPFAGSGSTLRAAANLGRKAIGVELEERYCEIIAKRMDQYALDFGGVQ